MAKSSRKGKDLSKGDHSPAEREKRKLECERYMRRGVRNQHELAGLLNVAQPTISAYISEILVEWRAAAQEGRADAVGEALARYNEMYTTAMEGYESTGDVAFLSEARQIMTRIDTIRGNEAPKQAHMTLMGLFAAVDDKELSAKHRLIEARIKELSDGKDDEE